MSTYILYFTKFLDLIHNKTKFKFYKYIHKFISRIFIINGIVIAHKLPHITNSNDHATEPPLSNHMRRERKRGEVQYKTIREIQIVTNFIVI